MDWVFLSKLIPLFLYPLSIFFILMICGIFLRLLGKNKTSTLLTVLAMLILLISAIPQTPRYLIKNLEQRFVAYAASEAPKADAVLVLGGTLALPLAPRKDIELVDSSDRVRYAAKLYQANKAEKIIIAGGNVFEQAQLRGEAFYIAQLLIEWGVPQEAILFEETSRNTYQNAVNVKPLLTANRIDSVLLVTSATHMRRAHAVFKKQRVNIIAAPTDFMITENSNPEVFNWLPTAQSLSATSWILKEYLGWYYYRLRGYL